SHPHRLPARRRREGEKSHVRSAGPRIEGRAMSVLRRSSSPSALAHSPQASYSVHCLGSEAQSSPPFDFCPVAKRAGARETTIGAREKPGRIGAPSVPFRMRRSGTNEPGGKDITHG